MNKVDINPKLITWARERAGLDLRALEKRFPKVAEWETGDIKPTFRQLEQYAGATLAPFGAFFLPEPPTERLPVPDYRTLSEARPQRPSAALLETIYQMQRRQEWMSDYLAQEGEDPLPFIGTVTQGSSAVAAAESIRSTLGMADGWAEQYATWTNALLGMRRAAEEAGIIVVINGVFGNNTNWKLDVEEFRGFVLNDRYAPLVFINGADFKSSQMFTLAHELAHLWVGTGGVFDLPHLQPSNHDLEKFCNRVAAEMLIPGGELEACWSEARDQVEPFKYLARRFKVSPIVAARRALDHSLISRDGFFSFWNAYRGDERRQAAKKSGGGDFYKTQEVRVGHRFGGAVVRAARSGTLLYQEAYRLTGLYGKTFDQFADKTGYTL